MRHGLGDPRTPENHPKDAVDLRDEDLDVFGEGQDDELGQLWMKFIVIKMGITQCHGCVQAT